MENSIFEFLAIAFASIFLENIIFSRGIGTNTLNVIARKPKYFLGFSVAVLYITLMASMISFGTNELFGDSKYIFMLKPLIFVICVGIIYTLTLLFLWKFFYKTFCKIKKFIHISAFNSAIFGSMFILSERCNGILEYLIYGIGMAVGFIFAIYIVGLSYEKLYAKVVPFCFRGYPLLLIYIGIISMAFYGLTFNTGA